MAGATLASTYLWIGEPAIRPIMGWSSSHRELAIEGAIGAMGERKMSIGWQAAGAGCLMAVSVALAGCVDNDLQGPFAGDGLFSGDGLFNGERRAERATAAPAEERLVIVGVCPPVQIRPGAASYVVYQGGTADPSRIRYQAAILDTARECFAAGGVATIRVGVAGRIVAGPRGTGGTATARLRIAVIQGGDQVLFSQAYTVSADIGPPNYGDNFTLVEEAITINLPPQGEDIQIVVGFDQN